MNDGRQGYVIRQGGKVRHVKRRINWGRIIPAALLLLWLVAGFVVEVLK